MKKLTLPALIASVLFITGCSEAQEATESAMEKSKDMASEMTDKAADMGSEAMDAAKDMGTEAMDAAKDMGTEAMDKAAEMASDVFQGAGFHTGTMGHPVGTQADIDALTAEYHAKKKEMGL